MKNNLCPFCNKDFNSIKISQEAKKCIVCGNEFSKRKDAIYCSEKCKQKYWRMKD